jgi:rSAM/selenodomain-associated transferase 1
VENERKCHAELGSAFNKFRVADPRGLNLEDRCLLFFVKYPEKGRVKSRLSASIGDDSAVNLYKQLATQMFSNIKRGTFPFCISFYPENAEKAMKEWFGSDFLYLPQNGKDLGERMKNGFIEAFKMGSKRVVLIGSDIPDLPLEFIEEAFKSLEEKDVVIGPAYDGGYYLIGFKEKTFSPQVFEEMDWGTKTVFDETMKVLKQLRKRVHTLPYRRDIDTVEDLKNLDPYLNYSND